MDLATGIVQQIRNHAWLNAFNFLILLALCAKHDVKVLLTKLHALAVVFYRGTQTSTETPPGTEDRKSMANEIARILFAL